MSLRALVVLLLVSALGAAALPAGGAFPAVVVRIVDDATGGDCASVAAWNPATKTCTLTSDLPATLVSIESSGVALVGAGHTVGDSVWVSGTTGVSVSDLATGAVFVKNATATRLLRLTVEATLHPQAILVADSRATEIGDSTIRGDRDAVYLIASTGTVVRGNTILGTGSAPNGVVCYAACVGTAIEGNAIRGFLAGAHVIWSSTTTVRDNTLVLNKNGVNMQFSSHDAIERNRIFLSGDIGIYVWDVVDSRIAGNTLDSSGYTGVWITGRDVVVESNLFRSNAFYGVQMHGGSDNLVRRNVFEGNAGIAYAEELSARNVVVQNDFQQTAGIPATTAHGGTVFWQPFPVGGNHWGVFDEPVEDCFSVDNICTDPYVDAPHGVVDELPWTPAYSWLDATAPTTTATFVGLQNAAGWWRTPVEVTLTASDARSGVASTESRVDAAAWQPYGGPFIVSGDGTRALEYRSTDADGNVEPAAGGQLRIDTTPPAIAGSPSDATIGDAPVTVTFSATDPTSGVASVAATLDGSAVASGTTFASGRLAAGVHVLVVTATDHAGNTATATFLFRTTVVLAEATPFSGVTKLGKGAHGVLPVFVEVPGADPATFTEVVLTGPGGSAPAIRQGKPGDHDRDGIPDLQMKFERALFLGASPDAGPLTLTVTGFADGSPFRGTFDVIVKGP